MNRILTGEDNFPISPNDIDISNEFVGAFGDQQTETSAGWIVRFAQDRGRGWQPFTYDEIENFYSRWHRDGFSFNRLVPPQGNWIVKGEDKKYYMTGEFVERCHKASPYRQSAHAS